MVIDDIITVEITDEMVAEAWKDQKFMRPNIGNKSEAAVSQEHRDFIGSLGHQAVEYILTLWQVPFKSLRKLREPYGQGDGGDIHYDNDVIDVKTTFRNYDEKYFYNQNFLVFQSQVDSPKFDTLSHLLFVVITGETWKEPKEAKIFGIISTEDFLEEAEDVKLMFDNKGIRAYQLVPFRDYIFK